MHNVFVGAFGAPLFLRERSAWLDREAMRIVAGTHTASRDNTARAVSTFYAMRGVPRMVVERETKRVLGVLDARIRQLEALLRTDPFAAIHAETTGRRA
ncbi:MULTISPECIES: hypothetical protein [unclassified Phyllobacterium]|uniref:hypothetical protein n=1 Tax=unclassified Phyllobacterium TaxID=2638441 RepID=UPI0030131802